MFKQFENKRSPIHSVMDWRRATTLLLFFTLKSVVSDAAVEGPVASSTPAFNFRNPFTGSLVLLQRPLTLVTPAPVSAATPPPLSIPAAVGATLPAQTQKYSELDDTFYRSQQCRLDSTRRVARGIPVASNGSSGSSSANNTSDGVPIEAFQPSTELWQGLLVYLGILGCCILLAQGFMVIRRRVYKDKVI